jgi:two-component system osmolarity sensor histidine kinase EnvZ
LKPLRIWPSGLIGRVTLVLVCAVLVEFIGSSILYELLGPHFASPWLYMLRGLGSLAVLSLGVGVAAVILLRSIGAPLRALTDAAESVGQGTPVYVREEGARDLQRVARAFNAMQKRIRELITTRTHALAAVSHDLRTPLTRLRLRAGLVRDAETRNALEADVDEMSAMLDSLLAYLAGRHGNEERRLADVASLCMTVTDAAEDAGGTATYSGVDALYARIHPIGLRRAMTNLVENAILYGGEARVSLAREGDLMIIRVEDDGPGVPEAELRNITEPFHRLDDARARATSGLGLGLSIVRDLAKAEDGELCLSNRPIGGFSAELRLPIRS